MQTLCEAAGADGFINFPFMGKAERKISAEPLFERIGKRGGTAAFAKKINASEQRIANWKHRGIPAAEVGRVASAIGISYEQYMKEAGQELPPVARQPAAQYTIEAAKLLEDYNALPDWLQEHIARKAAELRNYAESLPAYVRDGMKGPPKDPASYADWERHIVEEMLARRVPAKSKDRK